MKQHKVQFMWFHKNDPETEYFGEVVLPCKTPEHARIRFWQTLSQIMIQQNIVMKEVDSMTIVGVRSV